MSVSALAPRLRAALDGADLQALWVAYGLMLFSMAALGPVLGDVRVEFAWSFPEVGLLVGAQGMGRGGFTLLLGPLADRVSPRRLLPLGLLVTGAASLVAAAAPVGWVFAAGMVAAGAGSGLVAPGGQVHLARRGAPRERRRNIARVMSGGTFGAFVAPIAVGALAGWLGWRAAFLLTAALALAAAALVASVRSLESSAPPAPADAAPRRGRPARLRLPRLGIGWVVLEVSVLAVLLWGWNNAARGYVLPVYSSEALGLDPGGRGLLLGLATGGRAVLTYVSGAMVNRLGMTASLLVAAGAGVVGTLLMFAPPGHGVSAALVVAYTFTGVSSPIVIMLLSERAPRRRLGRAIGVTQFLVDGVGLGLTPLLGLLLAAAGFGAVGLVLALVYAAAAVWGLHVMRRHLAEEQAPQG